MDLALVTTQTVAEDVGVSRTCVSLVLNDSPGARIAPETRRRVLEAARRLGYESRAPREATRVGLIAYVMVCDRARSMLRSPWTVELLAHLQVQAERDGRAVLFHTMIDQRDQVNKMLSWLKAVKPLSVVLDGQFSSQILDLIRQQVPHVVLAASPTEAEPLPHSRSEVNCDEVYSDSMRNVAPLMSYLDKAGATSIALVSNPVTSAFHKKIVATYRQWLDEHGKPFRPELVQVCAEEEAGVEMLMRFQSLGVDFDGVLFSSVGLARLIISVMDYEQQAHGRPLPFLATIATADEHRGVMRHSAVCACPVEEFAHALYQLLASGINNPQRKPRRCEVAAQFLPPAK